MIDTPQIVHTTAQIAAVIRLTIPRIEIRNVMAPAMADVMAAVTRQGLAPAGPVFSHHFRMDPGIFDFEVGVPLVTPISAAGRVTPGQLPAATVARTIYHGTYEDLGPAWREFDAWIAAEGHGPAPNLWECYLAAPESSPDPTSWRTELNRPLIR